MQVLTGNDPSVAEWDEAVAQWVSDRLGAKICPPLRAISFLKDGELVGAAIFSDYTPTNVEITVYGPGAVTRQSIRVAFAYAFHQLKVLRLTARTRRGNVVMRKLLPRLGFIFEGTEPLRFGPARSDDALRFRLTPDLARKWLY